MIHLYCYYYDYYNYVYYYYHYQGATHWRRALELPREMSRAGVAPDAVTGGAVVSAHARACHTILYCIILYYAMLCYTIL